MRTFAIKPGEVLAPGYVVVACVGRGAEGEVYKIRETSTHLTRAAKLFYPAKHSLTKRIVHYARKLDRLRDCDIVIKYLHTEQISINDRFIHCLISEYFDGIILEDMIQDFPGRRLPTFEALSLVHALTIGIAEIHTRKEFHGDIHTGNIFVERQGVFFKLRTLDFHDWGRTAAIERRADILAITRLLYDLVGGRKTYPRQPEIIREICMGLRSDLVLKKFPTIYHLKAHLESFPWD